MAAAYPAAIKTFSNVVNGTTKLVAALFNSPYEEIVAIQTELGADVAGTLGDLKTRLAVLTSTNGRLLAGLISRVTFTVDGTILEDYNVSSITDTAPGKWNVNWDIDYANDDAAVVATAMITSSSLNIVIEAVAAAYTTLWSYDIYHGLADPTQVHVIAIGTQ